VTWRSVPGGCRRGARFVLTVVPVGPGRRWLFLFGAKERGVEGKRDGRGSLTAGRNGPGRREKAGRQGFPQWEGTGQEEKGEGGMAGVPSQWEETSQEEKERDVSKVGSGVGGWFGRWTGSGVRIGIGIGMSSAGSARYFCCLGRAMVGLRAAGDSRLGRWGSSAQRGVRVLSAGRNTGSGADSVDAVKAVGFRANFLPRQKLLQPRAIIY
jgi:hypothetical protein